MRVHCEMCDSLVPADDVHSCFDAALLRQHREAERAVIEAADRWSRTYLDYVHTKLELAGACAKLRELRGES